MQACMRFHVAESLRLWPKLAVLQGKFLCMDSVACISRCRIRVRHRLAIHPSAGQHHHVHLFPRRSGHEFIGWQHREQTPVGILERQGEVLEARASVLTRCRPPAE